MFTHISSKIALDGCNAQFEPQAKFNKLSCFVHLKIVIFAAITRSLLQRHDNVLCLPSSVYSNGFYL